MDKRIFIILFIFFISIQLFAQENKKQAAAVRISEPPDIDGLLNEPLWNNLPALDNFVQFDPYNGSPASQKTTAYVCYDDEAIYVGAFMHDTAPDSMGLELGLRDSQDEPNAQLFTVHISPYNDGMNSFYFAVSCREVQSDFKISAQGLFGNWDAVWESEVALLDDGWSAEIKIPFSALRFPDNNVQEWGFNMFRYIPRHQEWCNWSFVSNKIDQWWKNMGLLTGITDVDAPTRLSFSPYVSSYVEKNEKGNWGYSYNGGLDLKYGIDDSFTLDMTLIPDFGQVEFDEEELNLTPYEIKYNEKRQFFTEGTELFNKGDIFYSRRIGSAPAGYYDAYNKLGADETIIENPNETQIINVSKLSGRTNGQLGIGVMNAVTANTYATVRNSVTGEEREILTQPFTNYNFLVLDQSLANNSYISLINSNVWREDYIANVTASEFRFADSKNNYSFKGIGAFSQIYTTDESIYGYKALVEAGKVSGEFQFGYNLIFSTDTYNQNDFGYLRRNNEINQEVWIKHSIFDPFGIFRNMFNKIAVNYSRMNKPDDFANSYISYEINGTFKNNYSFLIHALLAPIEGHDYYEPRSEGRYFKTEKYFHNCFTFRTDRADPFHVVLNGSLNISYDYQFDKLSWSISSTPRYRFNDQFSVAYSFIYAISDNEPGYVNSDPSADNIYFGLRDRVTISNTVETSFLFNNVMSLNFKLRHYWSIADYSSYYELMNNGSLTSSDYNTNHDINYNAFTIDMMFTWNFAPGSDLLLCWKNSIYGSNQDTSIDYFSNFRNTIDSPQINSFSVKILYYIDYLSL